MGVQFACPDADWNTTDSWTYTLTRTDPANVVVVTDLAVTPTRASGACSFTIAATSLPAEHRVGQFTIKLVGLQLGSRGRAQQHARCGALAGAAATLAAPPRAVQTALNSVGSTNSDLSTAAALGEGAHCPARWLPAGLPLCAAWIVASPQLCSMPSSAPA